MVLSFHGRFSRDHLDQLYRRVYEAEADEIRREVLARGHSYHAYPEAYHSYEPGRYGMAWLLAEFFDDVAERIEDRPMRRTAWMEQGWDSHHDVIVFQRQ